ncbi:MAG: hybrid sensor histidine kinase/response regulator, partial [Brasilonema sp.]
MNPLLSNNEAARLVALHQYQILGTSAEQTFDDLAFLAAQICATPIALINLIDANRQCFKAKVGLDIEEMPVDIGFCPLCIQLRDVLIIPDTLSDEQFATSPVVTSAPYVRFYAGVPIITSEGQALGTICVADHVPRKISPEQVESLKAVSRLVMKQLELRQNFTQITHIKAEYQQAQKALQQSESTFRSFFDSAPMMMGIVELLNNDDILHISDNVATATFFGLAPGTRRSCFAKELGLSPDNIRNWIDYFHQAKSLQLPVSFEFSHSTLDSQRWLKATVSSIGESSVNRPRFAYIVEEITERKQAEQQIREQAALLDIVTDAIIVRDLNNKILLWNKSAENLYGWNAQEALGKNAEEILHHESLLQHREIYKNILESGSWQGELTTMTKSSKEIIVESHWTLVRDENFQPKSILVVDTDITQKKQLEKQFLRNQRLESIGTLTSGIAHDLNNVLSPILMSAQMLKAECHDERSKRVLTIVENNAKRGANLVKQVLSFARGIEGDWAKSSTLITDGENHQSVWGNALTENHVKHNSLKDSCSTKVDSPFVSHPKGVRTVLQLKHLISEMTQIVEQTFPKSIDVETEIESNLLPICGDSTQIYQVLMNLCLNGRDAMTNGGTLKMTANNAFIDENFVKMHQDAKVGSYIVLTVSDTGIGIPSELLDKIFEPFFTTKEFAKGTGLGLSTVMSIIKSHDGFITVSSSLGKGTKFQVYLPAVKTAATQLTEDLEIIPTGCGEWILIVDDEPAIREITKVSLEKNNYQAMTANDGIEAVALYAQHKEKISAAIIDMMMPEMDGVTTINTLHKMNPLLPIIAVSGLATSEQIPLDEASKIIGFLSKPHTAQE